jgi:hypothetical protein
MNYNTDLQGKNSKLQSIFDIICDLPASPETEVTQSQAEKEIISRSIENYTNYRITNIGNGAFRGCVNLVSVNFPAAAYVGNSAFCYCTGLISVNFPIATYIGNSAFYGCVDLTSVNFPLVTTIGQDAFEMCWNNLTSVIFPAATTLDNGAFGYCSKLTSISFPACTIIGGNAFYGCSTLASISFPACTTIGSQAFRGCRSLTSVFLAGNYIAYLSHSNAFSNTNMSNGYFYVPSSLITAYQTATNWTYFSSRFSAIENCSVWDGKYSS